MAQSTPEDLAQLALLFAPVGAPGSGAVRYAAAMHFHTHGLMPPAMLEIYRCCSKIDGEDPVDLARFEGVSVPDVAVQTPSGRA